MRPALLAIAVAVPAMTQEAPLAEADAAAQRAFLLPGLPADEGYVATTGEAAVVALLPTLEGVRRRWKGSGCAGSRSWRPTPRTSTPTS